MLTHTHTHKETLKQNKTHSLIYLNSMRPIEEESERAGSLNGAGVWVTWECIVYAHIYQCLAKSKPWIITIWNEDVILTNKLVCEVLDSEWVSECLSCAFVYVWFRDKKKMFAFHCHTLKISSSHFFSFHFEWWIFLSLLAVCLLAHPTRLPNGQAAFVVCALSLLSSRARAKQRASVKKGVLQRVMHK